MSQRLRHSPHFNSSHRPCITSRHLKYVEDSTMRSLEKSHIRVTSIAAYFWNCSIITVVSLFLILYVKLYHRCVCTYRRKQYIQGSALSVVLGIHWGSWNLFPVDDGGLLYKKSQFPPFLCTFLHRLLKPQWHKYLQIRRDCDR